MKPNKNVLKTALLLSIQLLTQDKASAQQHFAIQLPEATSHPESIGVDLQTQNLYVGSAGNGSIAVVHQNGKSEVFQAPGTDGRKMALGVKVDSQRNRLWVAGGDAVYTYHLGNRQLLAKSDAIVKGENGTLLNDLVIDPVDGSAYLTDSFQPVLYKIDGQTLNMRVFANLKNIPHGNQNGLPYNLNGIVMSPDHQSLISIKTNDGTLWKISLAKDSEGQAEQIQTSEVLTKGDGLVWGEHNQLYVIRNFENKISIVNFNQQDSVFTVGELETSGLAIPTGGVMLNGNLVIANSQFGVNPEPTQYEIILMEIKK